MKNIIITIAVTLAFLLLIFVALIKFNVIEIDQQATSEHNHASAVYIPDDGHDHSQDKQICKDGHDHSEDKK